LFPHVVFQANPGYFKSFQVLKGHFQKRDAAEIPFATLRDAAKSMENL